MDYCIGIDTSHQKRYSGMVIGTREEISRVHKELSKILSAKGRSPPLHWLKLTKKQRNACRNGVKGVVESSRLILFIIDHKYDKGTSKKDFYLSRVPNFMSSEIEKWLRGKHGWLNLDVDDDYAILGKDNGTEKFVYNFIFQLGSRLTGKPVKVASRGSVLRATLKHHNGKKLEVIGRVEDSRNCNSIQLCDILLGYCLEDRNFLNNNTMRIKKI